MGLGAQEARRRRSRCPRSERGAVADGVVQRLGRGLARERWGRRRGPRPSAACRSAPVPSPRAVLCRSVARVALQRGQHLVELHRRRRLGDRDRVAVVDGRRRRRARRDVDEEVALEEDARADLQRRRPCGSAGPCSSISIVTTAASVLPGLPSILATLPTLTPAMRTGEFGRIELADWKTALTRKPCVNGMCLVKPEEDADARQDEHHEADREGVRARAVLARHALVVGCATSEHQRCRVVFSVVADWVPGTLPMTCLPTRKGSLPASHSFGWPGEAVFGIRVGVQVVVLLARDAPLAGAEDGPPSLLGPCGVAMMMKRCAGAVLVAVAEQAGDVAEQQRRVVADRLGRRQVGDRRRQDGHGAVEVLNAER